MRERERQRLKERKTDDEDREIDIETQRDMRERETGRLVRRDRQLIYHCLHPLYTTLYLCDCENKEMK